MGYTASDAARAWREVDLYAKAPGQSAYTKVATDTSGSRLRQLHLHAPPRATAPTASTRSPPTSAGNRGRAGQPDATTCSTPGARARAQLRRRCRAPPADRRLHGSGRSRRLGPGAGRPLCKAPGEAPTPKSPRTQRRRLGQLQLHRRGRRRQLQLLHGRNRTRATSRPHRPAPTRPRSSTRWRRPRKRASPRHSAIGSDHGDLHRRRQRGRGWRASTCTRRRPASGYTKVASDTSGGASGSFTYTAAAGDGSYSFYTIATDKAGNTESAPSAAPMPPRCSTRRRRARRAAHRRCRADRA